jgi:hypothetical protein
LVASSLFATEDRKYGKNYSRTFRFVFRGTINDAQKQQEFIENNPCISSNFFNGKDLLIGQLSIIARTSNKLTDEEKQLLESLKILTKEKKKFDRQFAIDAASCKDLKTHRDQLKNQWDNTEKIITIIESPTLGDPIYKFDVVLSRDGILFLKDNTHDNFKANYFHENTPSDYTKNIPIHRLIKTAMGYIKYLFHKNYHHADDDDSFLPATNLHPIRQSSDTEKIVRHQLEHFLRPISLLKRNIINHRTACDPLGIIQYADSFLYVFTNNRFISTPDADIIHKFIDKQKNEIEILSSDSKTIANSFLTQKNTLATVIFPVAFLVTIINIINYIGLDYSKNLFFRTAVIFGALGIGYTLKKIIEIRALSKRFKRRNKSNNILYQYCNRILNRYSNSNIEKGKFSCLYTSRLWLIGIKLRISHNKMAIFDVIILISLLLGFTYLLYFALSSAVNP